MTRCSGHCETKLQVGTKVVSGALKKRRTSSTVGLVQGLVQANRLDSCLVYIVMPNLHRIENISVSYMYIGNERSPDTLRLDNMTLGCLMLSITTRLYQSCDAVSQRKYSNPSKFH